MGQPINVAYFIHFISLSYTQVCTKHFKSFEFLSLEMFLTLLYIDTRVVEAVLSKETFKIF